MPRLSFRRRLLKMLESQLVTDLTLIGLSWSSSVNRSREVNHLFEGFLVNCAITQGSRYAVPTNPVPKCTFLTQTVPFYDESRFKVLARMNFQSFSHLLELIQSHQVFNGKHSELQTPIAHQLLIVLYRLGCSGEGGTVKKISFLFGLSDGGALDKITKRILTAILCLKEKFLFWPDAAERRRIVKSMENKLPNCIGYIDGSEIKFAERPPVDHESYFSRKKQFSMKIQVVCDSNKKIRHVVTGYPGAVHDARIYSNCELTKTSRFFSNDEWLAGDSAYTNSTSLIVPYKSTSRMGTQHDRNFFNYELSRYRVRIENAIGILKERFSSLKEIRTVIKDDKSLNFLNCWVVSCCILHNYLIEMRDDAITFKSVSPPDQIQDGPNAYQVTSNPQRIPTTAESKREGILNFLKSKKG